MKYNLHLLYTRHNKTAPPHAIEARPIAYYELTLVFKGTLYYSIGDTPLTISAGEAVLLPPGTLRSRATDGEIANYLSFNFTAAEPVELPMHLFGSLDSDVRLVVAAFDEIEQNTLSDNRKKTAYLLACLLALFEDKIKNEAISPLTKQIVEYVNKHLGEKITLAEISRLTFFSPVYCDTVFKRDMGKSIIDYVLARRISEAKKHLLEDTLSLPAVALELGFADYNYFARVFKKRTGYTPTAYRKMIFSKM